MGPKSFQEDESWFYEKGDHKKTLAENDKSFGEDPDLKKSGESVPVPGDESVKNSAIVPSYDQKQNISVHSGGGVNTSTVVEDKLANESMTLDKRSKSLRHSVLEEV